MILVFGTVCLDRIRHIPFVPTPGAYVEIEAETLALGGEAANTVAHLRRWGVHAELRGNGLAGDVEGVLLESYLAERGMAYSTRAVDVDVTPVCDVYVTPDGERTMFGMGFRTMIVPPLESFNPSPGGWFTTDANLGEVAEAYAAKAKEFGMRLYLMDLPTTSKVLGPGVIWQTSTRWFGDRGNPKANAALVSSLVDRTGCTAILTDSGRDVVVGRPNAPVRTYPVFERPGVKDSTGAGDTLRAGVMYGLEHGWEFGECLSFGTAAASLAAGFIGASEGPSLAAVEAHLKAHAGVVSQYA